MKPKHKLIFALSVLVLLASGFLRDYFMLNVNHVLKFVQGKYPNYSQPAFYFLESWTVKEIMILKWVLTVLFFFYFWLVSWWVLKTYFASSGRSVKPISYVFVSLMSVAGIFYVAGYLFGIERSMYHVVRTLTGLTHSFLPAMLVFLYLKYFPQSN